MSVLEATKNFLEEHDNENFKCNDHTYDIIHMDVNDTLVFTDVIVMDKKEFKEPKVTKKTRRDFESAIIKWYGEHDTTPRTVRYDRVLYVMITGDSAIMRRHVNVLDTA